MQLTLILFSLNPTRNHLVGSTQLRNVGIAFPYDTSGSQKQEPTCCIYFKKFGLFCQWYYWANNFCKMEEAGSDTHPNHHLFQSNLHPCSRVDQHHNQSVVSYDNNVDPMMCKRNTQHDPSIAKAESVGFLLELV